MAIVINVNTHRQSTRAISCFVAEISGPKMPIVSTLGERLKRAREARGLGANELGRRLGHSDSAGTVSRWESGEREPGWENARDAAARLNVPVAWLVGEQIDDGTVPEALDIEGPRDPRSVSTALLRVFESLESSPPRERALVRLAGLLDEDVVSIVRAAPVDRDELGWIAAAIAEQQRKALLPVVTSLLPPEEPPPTAPESEREDADRKDRSPAKKKPRKGR